MGQSVGHPTPWIAVFDLSVTRNSPAGSCVLAEVMGLADEYDITVFSDAFDNDRPERVKWVRVPLPKKPGFLRYMVFHALAPLALRKHIRSRGNRPVLVQATQGQFIGADLCYPHFCHRAYLANQWKLQNATGLRRLARWVSYRYNAYSERRAFLRARWVVAPSRGLMRELVATYPFLEGKVRQVANPVDVVRFAPPKDFDRMSQRRSIGLSPHHKVLCFAALGDFERKGLGVVIDALREVGDPDIRVLVVGGRDGEISLFGARAREAGIDDRFVFVGFQSDVRPFFWASDLFVFPSTYEIFSLVLIQAPAAGLPVIATRLYGFEEYAEQGRNCWLVDRAPASVRNAIVEAFADDERRHLAALHALESAQMYSKENFVGNWQACFRDFLNEVVQKRQSDPPEAVRVAT
jgi:glycosyltransferase involved in cell wall biosynthesis